MVVAGRAVTITGGHLQLLRRRGRRRRGCSTRGPPSSSRKAPTSSRSWRSGGSTRSSHPNLPAFTPDELASDASTKPIVTSGLTAAHAVPSAAIARLPRRRARHDHPLLDDRGHGRPTSTAPTSPIGWRKLGVVGQPDDARHPRLALALPRRGGSGTHARCRRRSRVGTSSGALYDDKLDAVRRFHAAGVKLIAGSDSALGPQPGRRRMAGDRRPDRCRVVAPPRRSRPGRRGSAAAIGVGDIAGRLERRPTGGSCSSCAATRTPPLPCSAILLTSSKTVAASREAAQERTHEGRERGLPGCRGRVRTGHRQHLRSVAVLRAATLLEQQDSALDRP